MRNLATRLWKRFTDLNRYLHGKGFFFLLTGNFLGQFFSLLMILIVAKMIPKEVFGGLRLLQGYIQFLIPVAAFGTTTAVLKFCAEDRPEEQRAGVFSYAVRRLVFWSVAVSGVFCLLVMAGKVTPHGQLAAWALVMVWTVPLQNLSDTCNCYLQALKRFAQSARFLTYVRAQNMVLVALLTYFFGGAGFVYGLVIAAAASLIPMALVIKPKTFAAKPVIPPEYNRIAVQTMVANSLGLAMIYADVWLLDHYIFDLRAIADYQWAAIFSLAAIQINATAQSIATPYFSERSEDDVWLKKRILSVQKKLVLGSIPIALFVLGGVWVLVETLYPNYRGAIPFAAILLLRYVLLASIAIAQMGLLGKGRHGWNVLGTAVGLLAGLVCGRLLLVPFGALGVAWGQVLAALAMAVATWVGVYVTFGTARRPPADA